MMNRKPCAETHAGRLVRGRGSDAEIEQVASRQSTPLRAENQDSHFSLQGCTLKIWP